MSAAILLMAAFRRRLQLSTSNRAQLLLRWQHNVALRHFLL